jgi:hypothetical protein
MGTLIPGRRPLLCVPGQRKGRLPRPLGEDGLDEDGEEGSDQGGLAHAHLLGDLPGGGGRKQIGP